MASPSPPYRILFVSSHVIQYISPLYCLLSGDPRFDIFVAYCSLQGAEPGVDPEMGLEVAWDIPLLEGYPWVHVPNRAPRPGLGRFFGLINPGLVALVRRGTFDVVVVPGYAYVSMWLVILAAKRAGIPVIMTTDATTLRCLESLSGIRGDGSRLQVVVVDDGSTDGTAGAVQTRYPGVALLKGTGDLWWPGAINMGVRHSLREGADYILFLNDDTIHEPMFLERLFATAEGCPRSVVGALLLQLENPERTFQCPLLQWGLRGWDVLPNQPLSTVPKAPWSVDFLPGNCVLYPRQVFEEVGLVDARGFPHYGADAEMSVRARKAGWELLIERRARVWNGPNLTETAKTWTLREALIHYLLDRKRPRNVFTRTRLYWRTAPLALAATAMIFVDLAAQLPGWMIHRARLNGRLVGDRQR